MADVSIKETFTLPSRGLIYGIEDFNPKITLRSMTTMEELKRNSKYDTEYKVLSDIIEDCIEEKLPIHVYDMCIGDYQFLIHKLRLVTYGSEYKMWIKCPSCGEVTESTVDLNSLTEIELTEEALSNREITLPITKKKVLLGFQTPRMLDRIEEKAKELARKTKEKGVDYRLLYLTMSFIKELDGKQLDEFQLESIVKKLPLKDVRYIINKGDELNAKVGLDTEVVAKCHNCGFETVDSFRFGPDFWNPTWDD